jgi:hypothetical protein
MANPDIQKRLVNQVFEQIEKRYAEEQKTEVVQLYAKFAQVIHELDPSPSNLSLVLDLLKYEVSGQLSERFEQIKAKATEIKAEAKSE